MDPQALELQIAEAVRLLRAGVPVAIPTETVYGLAAPIDSEAAIREVFRLKERPFFDPLIVHIHETGQLRGVAEPVSAVERTLMTAFWPGPCTFILKKLPGVLPLITSGLETVAVRMPSHRVAREILRGCDVPLAAPSANKFGRTSPTEAAHVRGDFPDGEVYVVDSGRAEHGLESTVLRVVEAGGAVTVEILRPGVILAVDVEAALAAGGVRAQVRRVESAASPGHTPHHYQPRVPLAIVPAEWLPLAPDTLRRIFAELALPPQPFALLDLSEDPRLAARELYAKLHGLSSGGVGLIVFGASAAHRSGPWEAVWDRLERAASAVLF